MGASDYQLFRWVLLPAAFPVILTGLRIGFTVALLSILGSETIASLAGLGHRIVHLAEGMDTARMFAYIAFAVAIALVPQHGDLDARGHERGGARCPAPLDMPHAPRRAVPLGRRFKRCMLARPGLARLGVDRAPVHRLGDRGALLRRQDFPQPALARVHADSTPCSRPPACRRRCGSPPGSSPSPSCMSVVIGLVVGLAVGLQRFTQQQLHADHPSALRHAADHHPAAVHPLFRHRPRLQDRVRREPRHLPDHRDGRRRRAEHQADPAHQRANPWARAAGRSSAG